VSLWFSAKSPHWAITNTAQGDSTYKVNLATEGMASAVFLTYLTKLDVLFLGGEPVDPRAAEAPGAHDAVSRRFIWHRNRSIGSDRSFRSATVREPDGIRTGVGFVRGDDSAVKAAHPNDRPIRNDRHYPHHVRQLTTHIATPFTDLRANCPVVSTTPKVKRFQN